MVVRAANKQTVARLPRRHVVVCVLACAVPAWAAEPAQKVFDLNIVGGSVSAAQRVIRVRKGDRVRWRITSDAPGELHLHAYHLEVNVLAGQPSELDFKAFATGRYRVEWHPVTGKPAAAGAHHAPPLATLEVHPQ